VSRGTIIDSVKLLCPNPGVAVSKEKPKDVPPRIARCVID
jgi:hypothetical protein